VFDAVHRWFELPKLELSEADRGYKFIVSPEGDAGVCGRDPRGATVRLHRHPAVPGLSSIPRRIQPSSTAPDVAVVLGTVRYPLVYYGDDRIIGALETPSDVLLLVNLGIQVALVIVTFTNPVQFRVVWTGAGSQVPELDSRPAAGGATGRRAPRHIPLRPRCRGRRHAGRHPSRVRLANVTPAGDTGKRTPAALSGSSPVATRHARLPLRIRRDPVSRVPPTSAPRRPASPPGRAPTVEPKPPDRPPTSASTPAPVDEVWSGDAV
jgi:hypothetical protein